MSSFDQLNRFLFEEKHVRGELVQLDKSYQAILANHQYPEPVKALLGELLAATSLLTATIKFEGEISVQLQGNGPVSYMVVNGNHKQEMRGVARLNGEISGEGLSSLIGKGNMIITITPEKGQRYQGIVPLEQETFAACLEQYFETSEQIPTRIWLYTDTVQLKASGTLIQLLPDAGSKEEQENDFHHICTLTQTLKHDEVFNLDAAEILKRLFHEEDIRLFDPQNVTFVCGCSEEKCLKALESIAKEELDAHLKEHGEVSMTCEFCLTEYTFTKNEILK